MTAKGVRRWLLASPMLAGLAAIGSITPALAVPVEVEITAIGATRAEAVAQGLVEAIQQVTGVAVSAQDEMRTAFAAMAVDDKASVAMAESSQSAIRRSANGVIRSYRILETEVQEPSQVVLRMSVAVEKFEPKGLGHESRRSIAVASFGEATGVHGVRGLLRDRVISYLTQARRFAVLDRANEQVYAQEMATLEAQAPVTERVRIGQVIGADYVVVGTVRRAAISRSDRTIALTGERIVSASSAVELDWQLLEIATRQVKWSGTVRLQAGGDGLNGLMDQAAGQVAEAITQAIYPMRLIDFSDPNAMVINQGAGTLKTGQRLRAMVLGKPMIDPYTNEPLGQVEREAGIVEVKRVDNKLSYAQLVSGRLPPAESDVVLRPAPVAQQKRGPAPPATAPVVRLPGDP